MAVFTKLNKEEIESFLNIYDIGKLEAYNEILEGIENTNYKIICNGEPYILTIFEKRVKEEDLPFFISLKLYLSSNNFRCPEPIRNKENKIINSIKNKKAIIISFIQGDIIKLPNIKECNQVGKIVGDLHILTKNFDQRKGNDLDINEWKKLINKSEDKNNTKFNLIFSDLKKEINFLEKSWPENLPSGVIHADLFKDNIFFREEKITGVIDFYFSCYHFFLYDICIVINDWCFQDTGQIFNYEFYKAIIDGYYSRRRLTNDELNAFNILLRAAAVRILVTRLHDYIFHEDDALVVKKDPNEYYNILKWHQKNKSIKL